MLKLKEIKKVYGMASGDVHALKGINLEFRKNEFVSILGQSGCGKTTMLNIIGGLDKYTSGDLIINGKSTKEFSDRDWDKYRNHSIGFIFQSYNLIPHQTVLGNVELALTIAGVNKEERTRRAKEALDKVGLAGKYDKKPNQLSGGQCQRVAIARALVNEPEILLADEPTGALDSETSVQIMELVKEIARERLVIMVTHNPELAEQYSTRIIRLLDGNLVSDSNPYIAPEKAEVIESNLSGEEKSVAPTTTKAKMSFWTAFKLSLQNLFTKKARTIMTAIAGSIGIIGVSAVLSVSNGVQTYVNNMQNDMLSGNPINIAESSYDLSSMMSGMSYSEKKAMAKKAGYVSVDSMIDELVERATSMENMMISNEIDQKYVDYVLSMPKTYESLTSLNYGIDVTNNIYTDFNQTTMTGQTTNNLSLSAIKSLYTSVLNKTEYSKYSSFITSLSEVYMQAPSDSEYILDQYNLVNGKVATSKDEVMIVLDKDSELTDLLLAQLGYYTQDQFTNLIYKAGGSDDYVKAMDKTEFSYEELLGKGFTWYPNNTVFNEISGNQYTPFSYNANSNGFVTTDSVKMNVVGILQPKSNISYGCLTSGFYYTEALTKHILETNGNSKISNYLKTVKDTTISSLNYQGIDTGILYNYDFVFEGENFTNQVGYVGSMSSMQLMMGSMMGGSGISAYSLSLRNVGGENVANSINIYSKNFKQKDKVLAYLDAWNDENATILDLNGNVIAFADRQKITYTDNLSIIMSMINGFINIITIALIAFTALSLVVSCVMIAIITYVSVVERIKEIGVIRSLGGRKKDVSHLFNAETFIIGLSSGVIGVVFTYILSALINLVVGSISDIGTIAIFPVSYAIIMILISIGLTLISGLMPARSAAKKDPVVALRTE